MSDWCDEMGRVITYPCHYPHSLRLAGVMLGIQCAVDYLMTKAVNITPQTFVDQPVSG